MYIIIEIPGINDFFENFLHCEMNFETYVHRCNYAGVVVCCYCAVLTPLV
jgi:hypothetical protein